MGATKARTWQAGWGVAHILCLWALALSACANAPPAVTPASRSAITLAPFLRDCRDQDRRFAPMILVPDALVPARLLWVNRIDGVFVGDAHGGRWQRLTKAARCNTPVDTFLAGSSFPRHVCVKAHFEGAPFLLHAYCSDDGGQTFRALLPPPYYEDFASAPLLQMGRPERLFATAWRFGCKAEMQGATSRWAPCESLVVSNDAGRHFAAVPAQQSAFLTLAQNGRAAHRLYVAHSDAGRHFLALHVCDDALSCAQSVEACGACAGDRLESLAASPHEDGVLLFGYNDRGMLLGRRDGQACQEVRLPLGAVDMPQFGPAPDGGSRLWVLGWGMGGRNLLWSDDDGQTFVEANAALPTLVGELQVAFDGTLYYMSLDTLWGSFDQGTSFIKLAAIDS